MSLVAYDSSDDSERDDPSPETRSSGKPGGLFASLPAPRRSEPAGGNLKSGPELPRAKKRSEPVRISAPEIRADSVSVERERERGIHCHTTPLLKLQVPAWPLILLILCWNSKNLNFIHIPAS